MFFAILCILYATNLQVVYPFLQYSLHVKEKIVNYIVKKVKIYLIALNRKPVCCLNHVRMWTQVCSVKVPGFVKTRQ